MFPHLDQHGRSVNIQLWQDKAVKELLAILEKSEGTKAIIWDESLAGPVGLVAKYTFLKEHGVIKMFALKDGQLPDVDVKNIIFITRSNLKLMDYIAANIHNEERRRRPNRKDFYLYFLPRKSLLCEKQLQNKGVYGSLAFVGEFRCEMFPVDADLLSLELRNAYRELYIEGDLTALHQTSLALVQFQKLYGRIPRIYGIGKHAQTVWELTKTISLDEPSISGVEKGCVDQMIILDRSVDLMSVLATQLTYEGLIDEVFGIENTTANFPAEKFSKQAEPAMSAVAATEKKQIILNSGAKLFVDLRDRNFNGVGQVLSSTAKAISSRMDERHGEKSVQDMKRFVERLPEMLAEKQTLATHTTIAELIKEAISTPEFSDELGCEQEFMLCADVDKPCAFIEDLMAKKAPLRTVLRLICMQCIAGSGLKQKLLDYYKREIVHVYGIETLLTLGSLERAGLLRTQTGSRTYAVLRKTLNLTVDDFSEIFPKDISYVHSFYAPLSIRIVEQFLKPLGWQGLKDVLKEEPSFEDSNLILTSRRGSLNSEMSQSEVVRTVLVLFIGGCTFAEVSALRFLAAQEDNNVEFVIATTKLVNKNTFLDCFIEDF